MTPNAQAPVVEPTARVPAAEAPARIPASSVPAVSVARMAEVDRLAIAEYGITLLQMMEQAGSHLAEVVRLELGGDLLDRFVVVVVGPGNNGPTSMPSLAYNEAGSPMSAR